MNANTGAAGREQLTADGVFSGGGIKGLAFAGALMATEEAGYREWHELAGTSAGAITAMALAAGYDAGLLTSTLDAFLAPLDLLFPLDRAELDRDGRQTARRTIRHRQPSSS